MKRINENEKITLTIGQLRRLVNETIWHKPVDLEQSDQSGRGWRLPELSKVPPEGLLMQEDESTIQLSRTEVSQNQIKDAEQVLIDNGIEEDEADAVLQALGYVLLDTELYPDAGDDNITEDKESEAWGLDGKSRPGWEYGGLR